MLSYIASSQLRFCACRRQSSTHAIKSNKDLNFSQFINACGLQLTGSCVCLWPMTWVLLRPVPLIPHFYIEIRNSKEKIPTKVLRTEHLPVASQRNFYSSSCHALPSSFRILPIFLTAFHWCPLAHRPSPELAFAGSIPSHSVVWRLLGDPVQNFCFHLPVTNSGFELIFSPDKIY